MHERLKVLDNRWIKAIILYFTRIDLQATAGAISYFALLSAFPITVVTAVLLPYFGLTVDVMLDYMSTVVPSEIYNFIVPVVQSILATKGVGTVSLSLLVMMWSMSRVVVTFRNAMNDIYGVKQKRMAVIERFVSMIWMIVIVVILGGLIVVASIGSNILELLPISRHLVMQIEQARTQGVIVGLFIGCGLFNWVLPSKKPRLLSVLIGTAVELIGLLGLTKAFGLYLQFSGTSYSFSQAIGSVILFLLWMNFVVIVALVGNIVIAIFDYMLPIDDQKKDVKQWLFKKK